MYFRISSTSVELHEPADTTAFHAACPTSLSRDDLAEALRRAEVGELAPNDAHVMVRLDAVRRLAAGRVGTTWERDLDAMLAYAARKSWLSDDGTRVRAHLVHQDD